MTAAKAAKKTKAVKSVNREDKKIIFGFLLTFLRNF